MVESDTFFQKIKINKGDNFEFQSDYLFYRLFLIHINTKVKNKSLNILEKKSIHFELRYLIEVLHLFISVLLYYVIYNIITLIINLLKF